MSEADDKRAGAAAALVRDEVLWLAAKLREVRAEKKALAVRMCNVLDAIYAENDVAAAAVLKHFGSRWATPEEEAWLAAKSGS